MTDPRLSRLIAQHERDAVCKTCRHPEDVHFADGPQTLWGVPTCNDCYYEIAETCDVDDEWYMKLEPAAHTYVPSFDVAEYVQGIRDGQSVEAGDRQPPLC